MILGLLGTLCLLTAVMPTAFFTQYTVQTAVAVASLVMIYLGLLLINVVRSWKNLITSQRYYLAGIALFLIAALLAFLRIGPAHVNLLMIGLILFETGITLALAMEFLDLQKAYIQSRTNEDHLKSLNTAMEQTQTMQENFITIMNHEMRTPLTVIAGYADLTARRMALQDPKDEEMIRNLRLIKSEALRLGRIVKNTDEGVRSILSAGTEETADVRRLLEDARDFCRPICDKNGNAIIIDCPSQVKVPCVRDNVLQALYNLILNASRHTRKGLIRLICRESGNEIILKVADNGDGMDEETKKHAFERGYSGDGGHGLGLTLCSEVAQRHHGRIWIENNQEGGTTVCLALPWAKQHKP